MKGTVFSDFYPDQSTKNKKTEKEGIKIRRVLIKNFNYCTFICL